MTGGKLTEKRKSYFALIAGDTTKERSTISREKLCYWDSRALFKNSDKDATAVCSVTLASSYQGITSMQYPNY